MVVITCFLSFFIHFTFIIWFYENVFIILSNKLNQPTNYNAYEKRFEIEMPTASNTI